jgi:hypothetical protein
VNFSHNPKFEILGRDRNSGLDDRLQAVTTSIHLKAVAVSIHQEAAATMLEDARLWETLHTASWVVGPYENTVTWMFDSLMSKNLNSKLKKEESYIYDPSKHGVKGSPSALGHGPYWERPADYTNYINHLLSNWIIQMEHIRGSYVQYPQDVMVALHEILHRLISLSLSFLCRYNVG